MKRRHFLVTGICGSLAGCSSILPNGGNGSGNGNGENTPSPTQDIDIPHPSLEEDGITEGFIRQNYVYLDSNPFEVSSENSQDNTTQNWTRENNRGLIQLLSEETVVEEVFYTETLKATKKSNTVNFENVGIPEVQNWGNLQLLSELRNMDVSLSDETNSSVVYQGSGTFNSLPTDTEVEFTVYIDKDDPIVTQFRSDIFSLEVSVSDNIQVTTPQWVDNAKDKPVVSGDTFLDAESLRITVGGDGGTLIEGSTINIIDPRGNLESVTVSSDVEPTESVYIAYQDMVPVSSIGQAPPISGRDNLLEGTYVCVGYSPNGDQEFEVQIQVTRDN